MKADRLISLLLLLQSRQCCSARLLAEKLEVCERTIYRDVDALCAAGVPVYAERGAAGGIALAEGYRRTLTHFSEDEIRALFISSASPLADLGLDRGFDRALEKLRGGLADVQRKAAEKARARIHLDQRRWNQADPSRPLLATLRLAVWDDRCLRVRYEDRNRKLTTRRIEPLGLVSKAGVWYVISRCEGDLRSFRVDRIRSVEELGERFERPAGFDLERYWSDSTARFARESRQNDCVVTFRAPAEALERIGRYWACALLERHGAQRLVRVTFPDADLALCQAVAWSDIASVIDPADLRERVVARARQVLERYRAPRRSVRSPSCAGGR